MKIQRIGQISLRAHDTDRAIAFYRDSLGLKFLFRAGNLAFFDCGGVRLMLDKPEDPQFDHPSSILYFFVEDIQKSFAELREKKVIVVGEPHMIARLQDREVWLAHFRDSEDNMHALMSEVPVRP
ncbi:MAG TPA: VOC family protein [Thermoanaerobaculia bacterium]|nr:VOC family protein [Thermoanaerobaculia bacterium]